MDQKKLAQMAQLLERARTASELLEAIDADRAILDSLPAGESGRLLRAIDRANNPDNRTRRRQLKAMAREARAARVRKDDDVLQATGIRTLRRKPVFTTPNVFPPENFEPLDVHEARPLGNWKLGVGDSHDLQHCYVCKQKYTEIHHFYDQLCPACAEFNFAKRTELADLRGRVALLTGGRVKIGYQAGLKLLRCGAHLIVTTRFPRDGAIRYAQEPDFDEWKDRLEIFGLDLRHTPSVEAFCHELLDTREPSRLHHQQRVPDRAAAARVLRAHDGAGRGARMLGRVRKLRREDCVATASALAHVARRSRPHFRASCRRSRCCPRSWPRQVDLFPAGQLDQDLQQVDLRGRNSWRLLLARGARRSSCSKCSWSTPSRRSSSTRGSRR